MQSVAAMNVTPVRSTCATVGAATPQRPHTGTPAAPVATPDTPHVFYVSGDASFWAQSPAQARSAPSPLDQLQAVAVALASMRDYEHPHRQITSGMIHQSPPAYIKSQQPAGGAVAGALPGGVARFARSSVSVSNRRTVRSRRFPPPFPPQMVLPMSQPHVHGLQRPSGRCCALPRRQARLPPWGARSAALAARPPCPASAPARLGGWTPPTPRPAWPCTPWAVPPAPAPPCPCSPGRKPRRRRCHAPGHHR